MQADLVSRSPDNHPSFLRTQGCAERLQRLLGIAGGCAGIFFASFTRDSFQIAAGAERQQRIFRQATRFSPFPDSGPDVLPECSAQSLFGVDQRAILLELRKSSVIDEN